MKPPRNRKCVFNVQSLKSTLTENTSSGVLTGVKSEMTQFASKKSAKSTCPPHRLLELTLSRTRKKSVESSKHRLSAFKAILCVLLERYIINYITYPLEIGKFQLQKVVEDLTTRQ